MDLKLDNPDAFAVNREQDGSLQVSLPSAGVSLCFGATEGEILSGEVARFLRETLTHSQYVLKRFKVQHTYLTSHIQSLIHKGYWNHEGFTEQGLDAKGETFKYETESLLEYMAAAFCFSKRLNEFMEDLPVKSESKHALAQWPSINAVASLPCFEEAEYKGEWEVPLRFTSSSTLAGLVKPIIFYDGSLDIALNNGKVKLYVEGDDALLLLDAMLEDDDLSEFNVAKQAWAALAELEMGVRRFINGLKANGYDSEIEYFDSDNLNIDGVHAALLELDKGLAGEADMKAINESCKEVCSEQE